MFQFDLAELFNDPAIMQYIIGGIALLIIVIVCYSIHNRLTKN